MDTKSVSKNPVAEEKKVAAKPAEVKAEVSSNKPIVDKEINALDKKVLSKDDEIKALKAQLSAAQDVNKTKKGDIKGSVNAAGDIAKICIGTNPNGQRVFKRANKLTEADIERRNNYIKEIKQANARKY